MLAGRSCNLTQLELHTEDLSIVRPCRREVRGGGLGKWLAFWGAGNTSSMLIVGMSSVDPEPAGAGSAWVACMLNTVLEPTER